MSRAGRLGGGHGAWTGTDAKGLESEREETPGADGTAAVAGLGALRVAVLLRDEAHRHGAVHHRGTHLRDEMIGLSELGHHDEILMLEISGEIPLTSIFILYNTANFGHQAQVQISL